MLTNLKFLIQKFQNLINLVKMMSKFYLVATFMTLLALIPIPSSEASKLPNGKNDKESYLVGIKEIARESSTDEFKIGIIVDEQTIVHFGELPSARKIEVYTGVQNIDEDFVNQKRLTKKVSKHYCSGLNATLIKLDKPLKFGKVVKKHKLAWIRSKLYDNHVLKEKSVETTSKILMIRPFKFAFNKETALDNKFQVANKDKDTHKKALEEFDNFVSLLRSNGLDVTVAQDTPVPYTPDSIFPNNWISFHEDSTICIYPMYTTNRRAERKSSVIDLIKSKFKVGTTLDLSDWEKSGDILEGTGSLVLDRSNLIAYAALSQRTNLIVIKNFCDRMGYTPVTFQSYDSKGAIIYHTNVVMCVGEGFVLICLDTIRVQDERKKVSKIIRESGKELIEISLDQMNHFAGNMLQVENFKGDKLLIMSTQAFESLSKNQIKRLLKYNSKIVHSRLNTIEKNGGGSARCMMAEIFLQKREK